MTRSLERKRVLVTRAEAQAGEAGELLRAKGAEAVLVPTIRIGPPDDPTLAEGALHRLSSYDWVAFTSQNGVDRAMEILAREGKDASAFGSVKVAAVGPATAAALERRGIAVALVAKESQGEGLAKEMLAVFEGPRRVLLLRAQVAREAFPEALRAAGSVVDVAAVYATRPAEGLAATLRALLGEGRGEARGEGRLALDAALFTSGSTVTHVCDALGEEACSLLGKVVIASIGPVTSETARRRGLWVDAEPRAPTLPALVDALEAFFAQRQEAPR